MLSGNRLLLVLMILPAALLANIAYADCVITENADSWDNADADSIVIFDGETPLAVVDIPTCPVFDNSQIYLPSDKLCDEGFVIIDGQACQVSSVEAM